MKIRVGVFFGGQSVEHEVSVITAMQAAAALDRTKYEPVAVYVTKELAFYTGENLLSIESFRDIPAALRAAQRVTLVRDGAEVHMTAYPPKKLRSSDMGVLHAALLAFHGTTGEDGCMQGMLETLMLPYTGCDVTASAIGMDKWAMKAAFMMNGVPCLPAARISRTEYYADTVAAAERAERGAGGSYPIIVKPYNLGSSVGIGLAHDRAELLTALEEALQYSNAAICERAITALREINCSVLGDADGARASVCEEPLGQEGFLSYADKYQGGGKGAKGSGSEGMRSLSRKVPAELTPEQTAQAQRLALDAFGAVGAEGVARVDLMLDTADGSFYVNEINTIPGSLSFYLWEHSGLSFTQLLDELLELAFKRRRRRDSLHFSFDVNLLANATLGGGKNGGKGGVKGGAS